MTELKPCPFCGGDADYRYENFGAKVWVQCLICGAKTSTYDTNDKVGDMEGKQYATMAWNRRSGKR